MRVNLLQLIEVLGKLNPLGELLVRQVCESIDCELGSGVNLRVVGLYQLISLFELLITRR
jgi:hypothetical protein